MANGKKKMTKKRARKARLRANQKPAAEARAQTAAREKATTYKVVVVNGSFQIAPVEFAASEAHASRSERVRRTGLNRFGEPAAGLPKLFALKLARKLQAARDRRRRRGRQAG